MDNKLLNLCKEVYELHPEWDGYDKVWRSYMGGEPQLANLPVTTGIIEAPLYTSDYIFSKLPYGTSLETTTLGFVAVYGLFHYGKADTPLKALLKLIIALDDAGELK
jgi:hypothetical protein